MYIECRKTEIKKKKKKKGSERSYVGGGFKKKKVEQASFPWYRKVDAFCGAKEALEPLHGEVRKGDTETHSSLGSFFF